MKFKDAIELLDSYVTFWNDDTGMYHRGKLIHLMSESSNCVISDGVTEHVVPVKYVHEDLPTSFVVSDELIAVPPITDPFFDDIVGVADDPDGLERIAQEQGWTRDEDPDNV